MSGSIKQIEPLLVEIESGSKYDNLPCGLEQQAKMLERSQRLFSLLLHPKIDRQSTLSIDLRHFFTKDVSGYFDPAVVVTLLRNLGREDAGVDSMGVEEYSKYCNAIWCFRVDPFRVHVPRRIWAERRRLSAGGHLTERYSVVKNSNPWPLPLDLKEDALDPSLWCWNQTPRVSRETAQRLANISLVLGWDQVFQREIQVLIWDWRGSASTQADLGTPLECLQDHGPQGLDARRRKELGNLKTFFEDYIRQSATPNHVRKNMRSKLDNETERGNVYSWMRSVQAVCWKPKWGDIMDWWVLNTTSSMSPVRMQTNLSVATQNPPAEIEHNRPLSPKGDILEYLYQICTGAEKKKLFVVTMLQKANDRISQEQGRVAKELMAWRTTQVNDWAMSILPVAGGKSESSHSPGTPSSPGNINPPETSNFQAQGFDDEKSPIMMEAKGSNTSSSTRGKAASLVNGSRRDMPDSSRRGQVGGREGFSLSNSNGKVEMRSGGERQNDNVEESEDCQTSRRQSKMTNFQSTE